MKLFNEETLTVTKIHTVARHRSGENAVFPTVKHYSVKLPTQELVFFLNANSETTFGDSHLYDRDNWIRYMPKGVESGEYKVVSSAVCDCIDIYFDSDIPASDTALNIRDIPEVKPLFLKLYNLWTQKKPGYYSEAMSVVYDIITAIRAHQRRYLSTNKASRLEPAVRYFREHLSDTELNYTAACNMTDLSYSYFKELFCKAYGIPPVKYVTNLRIERAKELLITGLYSVTEIAGLCGFRNVYYFSNVFKKQVGISPKDFRQGFGT